MKTFLRLVMVLLALTLLSGEIMTAQPSLAADAGSTGGTDPIDGGADQVSGFDLGPPAGTPQSIPDLVVTIINWALGVIGSVGVLVIVWGGYQYIISMGNPEMQKKAKATIIWAVIGIVIVGLAYTIVYALIAGLLSGRNGYFLFN